VALTHSLRRLRPLSSIAGAAVAATLVAALVLPGLAGATPAQPSQAPEPTSVAAAQAKLDTLARQNEAASEAFNLAQSELTASQAAAAAAQRAAAKALADYQLARDQFGLTVAAQYEATSFSAAGALFSSDSGQDYLDRVSTMSLLNQHRVAQVSALSTVQAAATQAQQTADSLLAAAAAKQAALAKQKAAIQADTTKYSTLLATLTVAQQLAFRSRHIAPADLLAEAANLPPAPNAKAQLAVDYAKAQLGKWYRFAAAGPTMFDCSGLTMMAWKQAGVNLPHYALTQATFGTSVSLDQLEPGDLIFLYRPITHVEIYVGNFLAISAPEEGEQVQYVDVRTLGSDFTKATRL